MNQDQLTTLLASLTAQLHTENDQEELQLEQLQLAIADAIVQQDPSTIPNHQFTFEQSDSIISNHRFKNKLGKIDEITKNIIDRKSFSDTHVFLRKIPIRTSQIAGGLNPISGGARIIQRGPFRDIHGIPNFFDFVNVKKLISLYIQGQANPVILFDATFKAPKFQLINAKPIELTKTFKVDPESIWIRANLFSPSAPANLYCGIRIKGGNITLSLDPFMDANRLTIASNCAVICDFQLEQNTAFATDDTSNYGVDARKATFNLPSTFKFNFQNNQRTIQEIGDASWVIYGSEANFIYGGNQVCIYNPAINRIAFEMRCDQATFIPKDCQSPFMQLSGKAEQVNSWWTLSTAQLDIANPLEADGNGAIIIECKSGLDATWSGLNYKTISLSNPFILGEPGRISFTDLFGNGSWGTQEFTAWKDDLNPFGTSAQCKFKKDTIYIFNTVAKGDEMIFTLADLEVKTDRPVKVNGEAVAVKTKSSAFILAASKLKHYFIAIDENILWDNKLHAHKIPKVKPYALAMHNALFTVTPPNSLVLFCECDNKFSQLERGVMFLGFGLYSYLPTLPDPYAANLGLLEAQFANQNHGIVRNSKRKSQVWMWLICQVKWEKAIAEKNKVDVSFHFAPLQAPLQVEKESRLNDEEIIQANPSLELFHKMKARPILENEDDVFMFQKMKVQDNETLETSRGGLAALSLTDFSLLDVSSNANQMGVAYAKTNNVMQRLVAHEGHIDINEKENANTFPIQIEGLDVVTAGRNAQAFTVPAIAWEPVFNLTSPNRVQGTINEADGLPYEAPFDPPAGFNYYDSDGFPTRIGNLSLKNVPLAPIPLSKYLVESYKSKEDGRTFAFFNLPFGMFAISILNNQSTQAVKPIIEDTNPKFKNNMLGGIQLELTAGTTLSTDDENNMFQGFTFQFLNINDANGNHTLSSTLAGDPTDIFNAEFGAPSALQGRPGVPVTNVGLSGYGSSMFSKWANDEAVVQVSKAEFNVITGRTSHELVQVKSFEYPMGFGVVRTITIFRLANGYVGRIDSGWVPTGDGKYNFHHKNKITNVIVPEPFKFQPGLVRGVYNIRNIQEIHKQYKGFEGGDEVKMQAVTYDADVLLENVSEGGRGDFVASKGILGYIQILPIGRTIKPETLNALLKSEKDSIGGEINCVIKLAGSKQRMKINRFDVNNSVDSSNNTIFVGAARGSLILPKDGSWSIVQHARKTGDVSPLPAQLSVPIIRKGAWKLDEVIDASSMNNLIQIAHPADLLKVADDTTINFGIIQNMATQKVLFMLPTFKNGIDSLLSKTPPLLADSFRLMNSKGIFPNVGDLENSFGQAISLLKGVDKDGNPLDAFKQINIAGVGDVLDVLRLDVKEEAGKILDQGYKLATAFVDDAANNVLKFDLPNVDYPLIDLPGKLVIRIQYNTAKAANSYPGKFDFNIDSFANKLEDTWKGRLNNLAIVVSLGPLTDVMKIKGNFNSQKGKEVDLGSKNASDNNSTLPTPEIEFSDALQPVIDILEILASLSTGEYGDVMKKGLKVAMSNSANIWEYKFEANKEIPLVRFPPTKALYDSPTTPLKLEASLGIGVFFNAALKVTTDPSQLLPTAGAYFKFHGGLQIMCLSVGAGTVYAVGQVDLKLEADTSPKIAVTLKFGFGVQVTVGLPVVGHASVLFMVGVEVYADSSSKVKITAFMLFKGHAELLGGLVGVTITIEAKGSVEKEAGDNKPALCKAQITFAIDISIFLIIDISFSESWEEERQIA